MYKLDFKSITTDTEIELVNAVNKNFQNAQRISSWFDLNQDLIQNSKIFGLMNKKIKILI